MPLPQAPYTTQIKHIHLLPAFFLLPYEFICKSVYKDLPRNAYMVIGSELWINKIMDTHFADFVFDRLNSLMWPAFHTGGSITSFSENDPIWRLSYHIATESLCPLKELGYSMDVLLTRYTKTQWLEYHSFSQAEDIAISIAASLIDEYGWWPIIEYIRKHRCFEDFSWNEKSHAYMRSRRYRDFERQWYHTRTKQTTVERIEGIYGVGGSFFRENKLDALITNLDYAQFLKTLTEEERTLLALLGRRMRQEDIAQALGYATHSAISKKQRKLHAKFIAWFDPESIL